MVRPTSCILVDIDFNEISLNREVLWLDLLHLASLFFVVFSHQKKKNPNLETYLTK